MKWNPHCIYLLGRHQSTADHKGKKGETTHFGFFHCTSQLLSRASRFGNKHLDSISNLPRLRRARTAPTKGGGKHCFLSTKPSSGRGQRTGRTTEQVNAGNVARFLADQYARKNAICLPKMPFLPNPP